ncbi:ankyrin repeat domain-containing protein [Flavobacterium humi]|uniref:Ankyrin repeat domain-containing protein n=1 Tax=Flavobacterium humi TaxID=2562683 RepID=A0A4Z0L930_9FLAO|nr:ankyrin repeat domain-containing protein [Flavobacterium humi]TGD58831.1 ankyrin repeat domain-containing protein [Flavobacterium humi]
MKKTIILGLALVAFANVSFASNSNLSVQNSIEVVFKPTPLCSAIIKGDLETVKKFIEYGADVNESSEGLTPLMLAARYNKAEIVTLLLEKGARIDAKDERGLTAAKYAEMSNATDTMALLRNKKA